MKPVRREWKRKNLSPKFCTGTRTTRADRNKKCREILGLGRYVSRKIFLKIVRNWEVVPCLLITLKDYTCCHCYFSCLFYCCVPTGSLWIVVMAIIIIFSLSELIYWERRWILHVRRRIHSNSWACLSKDVEPSGTLVNHKDFTDADKNMLIERNSARIHLGLWAGDDHSNSPIICYRTW